MADTPALIIIDMQKDFFRSEELSVQKERLVSSINRLVDSFSEKEFPIFWIWQEFKPDLTDAFIAMKKSGRRITIEGTEGVELLDELHVHSTHYQVTKKRYSGFYQTTLETLLAEVAPSHVYFAGINSHACVRTTLVDAFQRDYECTLVSDATASYDREHHEVSLGYFERAGIAAVHTSNEVIKNVSDSCSE